MSGKNRVAGVVPTRMSLMTYKTKVKGAKKGYDLLKMKADSLKAKFRKVMVEIRDLKADLGEDMRLAFMAQGKAEYSAGNFKDKLFQANHNASVRVSVAEDNVAGVKLPIFEEMDFSDVHSEVSNIGISGGGKALANTRVKWKDLISKLIKLASLQTSFMTLDEALKVTSRRVNALEYVVLPRIEGTISYIKQELDELDREDFSRIKKIKAKKEERMEEEEEEEEKKRARVDSHEEFHDTEDHDFHDAMLPGQAKDPDILF
eukprot:g1138.t1